MKDSFFLMHFYVSKRPASVMVCKMHQPTIPLHALKVTAQSIQTCISLHPKPNNTTRNREQQIKNKGLPNLTPEVMDWLLHYTRSIFYAFKGIAIFVYKSTICINPQMPLHALHPNQYRHIFQNCKP